MDDARSNYDEVDLVDLWLVMARYKWLLVFATAAGMLSGLAISMLQSSVYEYTTHVEIGGQVTDRGVVLLEDPDVVLAKLNDGYIQAATRHFTAAQPEYSPIDIEARKVGKTPLIYMTSEATLERGDDVQALHAYVVNLLDSDHQKIADVLKNELEIRIESGAQGIAAIDQAMSDIESQIAEMTAQQEKLKKELVANEQQLAKEARAGSGSTEGVVAMSAILAAGKLLQARSNLQIDVPTALSEMRNEIGKLKVEKEELFSDVEILKLELDNFNETKSLMVAQRSIKSTSLEPPFMAAAGGMSGAIFGLIIIGLIEFLRAVARRRAVDLAN